MVSTQALAATVRLFSPTDHLPPSLSGMSDELLSAHIQKAKRVIQAHEDIARNGNPDAEHYYFFIPEVARDMGNARYTLSVVHAEIERRALATEHVEDYQPLPPTEAEMDANFAQHSARITGNDCQKRGMAVLDALELAIEVEL